MDRRGHSEDNPAYAHKRELENIAAVIDSIEGPVDVLGHSFGALCSLEAILLSKNVRKLILYEPPMAIGGRDLSPQLERRMQTLIDAEEKEQVLVLFLREVLKIPAHELVAAKASAGWPASVAAAHTVPRECKVVDAYTFDAERFWNMQIPTVFFVGSDSPRPQHGIAAIVHAALPHSRIVLLPGEQHFALNTAPDLFTREVVKVLTEDIGLRKDGDGRHSKLLT